MIASQCNMMHIASDCPKSFRVRCVPQDQIGIFPVSDYDCKYKA